MADVDAYDSGLTHLGQNQFPEAIADFERALAADPGDLDVLLALSMAHSKAGDQDKAIEIARKAAVEHPDDPFPHTNLSMFLMKKGLKEEAELASAKATELSMKNR